VEEYELKEVLGGPLRQRDGVMLQAHLDIDKLRRILHEWKLLKSDRRRSVEVEILKFFDSIPHDTVAVSEIKKGVEASAPSIQRALKNLVKKKILLYPGRGTYRRSFGRL